MTEIVVLQHEDGALVVDSRLIASQLGIQHENFMDTLNKYKTQTEQAFGFLRFQTGVFQGRGQPEKWRKLAVSAPRSKKWYVNQSLTGIGFQRENSKSGKWIKQGF